MVDPKPVASGLWRSLRAPGLERFELLRQAEGWTLRGTDGGERTLLIAASGDRWTRNGRGEESLRGCVDVDLGWSPSTNTLPIRRLGLAIGARAAVTAAWVRFPELTLEPLAQEYERLGERRYRYTSAGGAFTAVLDVDDEGLVLEYAGGWTRVT